MTVEHSISEEKSNLLKILTKQYLFINLKTWQDRKHFGLGILIFSPFFYLRTSGDNNI